MVIRKSRLDAHLDSVEAEPGKILEKYRPQPFVADPDSGLSAEERERLERNMNRWRLGALEGGAPGEHPLARRGDPHAPKDELDREIQALIDSKVVGEIPGPRPPASREEYCRVQRERMEAEVSSWRGQLEIPWKTPDPNLTLPSEEDAGEMADALPNPFRDGNERLVALEDLAESLERDRAALEARLLESGRTAEEARQDSLEWAKVEHRQRWGLMLLEKLRRLRVGANQPENKE